MKNILYILLYLVTLTFYGQNSSRIYVDQIIHKDYLEVTTNDGSYHFVPYSNEVMETTFLPNGEKYRQDSHAVLQPSKKMGGTLTEPDDNTINYQTPGMRVQITKSPFQITYFYKESPLLSEKRGYIKTDTTAVLEFNLDATEVLYGGGSRVLGMNRRGNRLELYNKAHYGYENRSELMNYTMPLVLSSKKYMVHFDNTPIGFLDLDSKEDNILVYETISGRKTYQVIAGDQWTAIIDAYTSLTGKQPMPPRWALGNFASRFGYHSEKEVKDVVARFKKDSIPLDAVILDIYWFGKDIKGHMGNLEFLKDSFPTPKKMINDFKAAGIKTILVTEPFVLSTSTKWDEAVEKKILATDTLENPYRYDFYFGNTGLIDIFKIEGKEWFWDIYKKHTKLGIAGWWGDLGEPEVHPSDLQHATGTADELHNVYGHYWAKLLHEGYQSDFPEQRPFILMRSGYSGSQRFGMIPWSGDVNRSWGGLQAQPEIALQMGMQGLGYMHSDLGGFAGGEVFDAELYTRWLQYGVFQPIFRPHAQEHIAPEPVFHDVETKTLAKKAIELRYSLLPYNYTLAFENHKEGIPLMRSILFHEPDNTEALEQSEVYLWGNDFLVAPIMNPGLTEKDVYFPKNASWIDFYTGKNHEGGTTQKITVVADHIPVFVRAGAFIPRSKPIQHTEEYSLSNFELHFYSKAIDGTSKGHLYHDDGKTPEAYEKGAFELMKFEANHKKNELIINFSRELGNTYITNTKKIDLIIHNRNKAPEKVKIDGKRTTFIWDQEKQALVIPVLWNKEPTKTIIIKQ